MEIVPAIDILNGECVRLYQGDFNQKKTYSSDPLETALEFQEMGAKRLHLVDLDGAQSGKVVNIEILKSICKKTSLKVDFGGGIRSGEDLMAVLKAGVKMVTVGSAALHQRELFVECLRVFGAYRFMVAADVLDEKIVTSGWTEKSETSIFDFVEDMISVGVKNIMCTDVSKDGTLEGVNLGLYERLRAKFPQIHLVASGGVSNERDIDELAKIGINEVIVGKAFYEKQLEVEAFQV